MNTGTSPTGVEDVPDVSAELYLDFTEFARSTPSWAQHLGALFTEGSLVLLGGLLLLSWWRSRGQSDRTKALALLAPPAMVLAYLTSEIAKTFVAAERPCRALRVPSIVECPPPGDWSFPSNHSTIAGAIAIGVLIAWPRMGLLSVPVGALGAMSRVFVGAHYPHDAAVGFLLGATVAAVVMLALGRPATALVEKFRGNRIIERNVDAERTVRMSLPR